jgi:hypothetical protein
MSVFDNLSFSFLNYLPKYPYRRILCSFYHLYSTLRSTFVNGKMSFTIFNFQVDNIERRNTFPDKHSFPGHITFTDNILQHYLNSPLYTAQIQMRKNTHLVNTQQKNTYQQFFLTVLHRKQWQNSTYKK